jgi:ATP-dependent protease ClpP protease subunit
MKTNNFDPKLLEITTDNSYRKTAATVYEFYLSGEVGGASEYIDWFDTIRNATKYDTVKIYINSPGGDLYTTLQFLRVMSECEGTIITSVEGACMSAATMIFLHGHTHEVTPNSLFMFHNYSAGVFGKGGEMFDQLTFEREWSKNFMTEVYDGFLTESEIQSMLNNRDIWMASGEVIERLEKLYAKLESESKAEMAIEAALDK